MKTNSERGTILNERIIRPRKSPFLAYQAANVSTKDDFYSIFSPCARRMLREEWKSFFYCGHKTILMVGNFSSVLNEISQNNCQFVFFYNSKRKLKKLKDFPRTYTDFFNYRVVNVQRNTVESL